ARAVPHDVARNIQLTCDMMRDAAERGVQLLVLPECGLTGYVYSDASEVQSVAIAVDGPETRQVADLAQRLKMHVVIGMLESAPGSPTVVHNTALLIAPGGSMVPYRKTHLPSLGADRFVTAGNNQPVVVETELGRLGLSICYDLRFPEWARALALQGADVILNPTNWPLAAERVAELFTRVRAAENHVYVIAANRGDEENGVPFIGKSQIVDPAGTILASSERGADLLIADIVPTRSRAKDIAIPEDNFAISLFHDRRPNLYGALVRQDG
ncbi:MAG TPA: carbon-nitrogen hydrolase family protein, partial [Actinoplanes sp.]|nr:carbon-nitrogen hydrolase family protein [Actinoplanes sp.]